MKGKYVAVVESSAARDTQVCKGSDFSGEHEEMWVDWPGAELFVGVYSGSPDKIRKQAADDAETLPENIRLIDVDDVFKVAQ